MPTSEKINNSPQNERQEQRHDDYETGGHSDTLRHSLLAASEHRGGYVLIPRNTVMIEMNSNTIKPNSFNGLSGLAAELQEEQPRFNTAIHERGYGKLNAGSFMTSIDSSVRRDLNKDELSSNITLLYDGQTLDKDGETQIPSAILVHEELSSLQIKELREKLPAGVPLIDGKTNRLLDEVGAMEREEARNTTRLNRSFGSFAINGFGHYDRVRTQKIMDEAPSGFDDWDWRAYTDEAISNATKYAGYNPHRDDDMHEFYETKTEETPRSKTPHASATETPTPSAVPESEEVRAHAKKEERTQVEIEAYKEYDARNLKKAKDTIVETAQAMYGPNPGELSVEQVNKVERKVQSKLHPDRGYEAGGDSGAFKEAGVLLREARKGAEARETTKTESE